MSSRQNDGEVGNSPAEGEPAAHPAKHASRAESTISRIIDNFERDSRNAYGSGHDYAGTAYALRALEEADKAAAESKSFVKEEMQRRQQKAERAQSQDGGREI